MDVNVETMRSFYEAFSRKDAEAMNAQYHQDIMFSDPAFGVLEGEEVRRMWRMLCSGAKDFKLEFGPVNDRGDNYYTCEWKASYLFSATGNRVVNKAKGFMKIENGKITEHSDAFRFYVWARQAFGLRGWLLGWTTFFQRRVRSRIREKLQKFQG